MNIIETDWHWNGGLSRRSRTDYIALHHAECTRCTAAQVDEWHKANGWSGIGYHFFVRKRQQDLQRPNFYLLHFQNLLLI